MQQQSNSTPDKLLCEFADCLFANCKQADCSLLNIPSTTIQPPLKSSGGIQNRILDSKKNQHHRKIRIRTRAIVSRDPLQPPTLRHNRINRGGKKKKTSQEIETHWQHIPVLNVCECKNTKNPNNKIEGALSIHGIPVHQRIVNIVEILPKMKKTRPKNRSLIM